MIGFAVVGIGRMGNVHAKNIAAGRVAGARLIAVCDKDESKLSKWRGKVDCFTDYKKLSENPKIKAVVVSTEHYAHGEIAKYFLEKGLNVLVEKPLTVTTKEAKEVIETARAGGMFATMFNQRTDRLYKKAKELLSSGELGSVQRASYIITNWYRSQAYYNQGGWRASWSGEGGGTLINQCVHQLDLVQWLLGMPTSVRANARTVNRNITTENEVEALFRYDDFACTFSCSAHELHGTNRLEIACTKGRIVIEARKMKVYYFGKSEQEVNSATVSGYGNTSVRRRCYGYGLVRLLTDLIFGQQRRVLSAFAAAVENGDSKLMIARGEEGLNALTLINAVYLSNWLGEEVTLPFDDELYVAELKKRVAAEQ